MKKSFAFAFVLALVLTLTACASLPIEISVKTTDPVITPTETTEHIVPKPTEVIAPQQEPTTENPTEPPAAEPTEPPATEPTEPPVEKPTEGQIKKMKTKDEAKAIALNHAKVKASQVRELEIELDKEQGVTHYDVSFEAGNTEYDYEIEAYTGEILKNEKETEEKPAAAAETITKEKAKTIALNHAKVKAADVRDFEIELEEEKGQKYYEITFESGGYEYEYVINSQTGEILHQEKERD